MLQSESGITIEEIQAQMNKDPELRSRLEHIFQTYSGLIDDIENGNVISITAENDEKAQATQDVSGMKKQLDIVAQILKSGESAKAE